MSGLEIPPAYQGGLFMHTTLKSLSAATDKQRTLTNNI